MLNKSKVIAIVIIVLVLGGLTIFNFMAENKDTKLIDITTTQVIEGTTTGTTASKTTTKKATKKTTKRVVTTKVKVNENEMTSYLYSRVLAYGWTTEDYNAVVNIIIKESGFNPNNVNKSSGACGLFQAHPCKKAIKQYPDYMTNYKSQIEWGLNYIKGRYKTPVSAWKFWQQHHWY